MAAVNSLNAFISILLITTVSNSKGGRIITVFSDFTNEDDLIFFRSIFPWLIDNLGPNIRIDYQFKDSGMASGPRKCILQQMEGNTFLQASYLKHEAEGKPKENFLYNFPIDSRKFSSCLFRNVNYYLKEAQRKFSRLRSDETPVVLVSRDEVSGLDPDLLLDSVCQLFGRREPQGCIDPRPFDNHILFKELSPNRYNSQRRNLSYRRPTTETSERLPKKTRETNSIPEKYFYNS